MKRCRFRPPFEPGLDAPRIRAVAVHLWRERMRSAGKVEIDFPHMGVCAFDAAQCLDAPDHLPAGSMASGDAWTYLTTFNREFAP